ncbi:hypothetical protein DPMN_088657 [Dreissena polymorpha]|uniref:Uncharacterized protein n=1 Tax=Dreissena polymorpha TaxID=45954 RepID=A0A9D4KWL7_DREPO|nr:hypothetical protein DPMN_088657 [Dreissena polymorpha]
MPPAPSAYGHLRLVDKQTRKQFERVTTGGPANEETSHISMGTLDWRTSKRGNSLITHKYGHLRLVDQQTGISLSSHISMVTLDWRTMCYIWALKTGGPTNEETGSYKSHISITNKYGHLRLVDQQTGKQFECITYGHLRLFECVTYGHLRLVDQQTKKQFECVTYWHLRLVDQQKWKQFECVTTGGPANGETSHITNEETSHISMGTLDWWTSKRGHSLSSHISMDTLDWRTSKRGNSLITHKYGHLRLLDQQTGISLSSHISMVTLDWRTMCYIWALKTGGPTNEETYGHLRLCVTYGHLRLVDQQTRKNHTLFECVTTGGPANEDTTLISIGTYDGWTSKRGNSLRSHITTGETLSTCGQANEETGNYKSHIKETGGYKSHISMGTLFECVTTGGPANEETSHISMDTKDWWTSKRGNSLSVLHWALKTGGPANGETTHKFGHLRLVDQQTRKQFECVTYGHIRLVNQQTRKQLECVTFECATTDGPANEETTGGPANEETSFISWSLKTVWALKTGEPANEETGSYKSHISMGKLDW